MTDRICSVDDCDSPVRTRGRCRAHYQEWHREYARRKRAENSARSDIPHGTENGYTNYGCRCPSCGAVHSTTIRRTMSPEAGLRHGMQWTGPEIQLATRDDLSLAQAAAMLGRTPAAVSAVRVQCRIDPRYYAMNS